MQTAVAEEERGRAMGSWVLSIGTAPIGHLGLGGTGHCIGGAGSIAGERDGAGVCQPVRRRGFEGHPPTGVTEVASFFAEVPAAGRFVQGLHRAAQEGVRVAGPVFPPQGKGTVATLVGIRACFKHQPGCPSFRRVDGVMELKPRF